MRVKKEEFSPFWEKVKKENIEAAIKLNLFGKTLEERFKNIQAYNEYVAKEQEQQSKGHKP